MKEYLIQYCKGEPDWASMPTLKIEDCHEKEPVNVEAFAQIGYNDEALLVHLWVNADEIRAEERGPMAQPCCDSCLEFFFSPIPGDNRYFNIEFNSIGTLYLGVGSCIDDLLRLHPERDGNILKPDIRKTEGGWEIFYTVPYELIRRIFPTFEAVPGMQIRANCFTCSDLAKQPYHISWNPVTADPFNFHHTPSFGLMVLSEK